MGVCKFKISEVLRCVAHAISNNPNDGSSVPSLLFVHDSGVYIMSNGKPMDLDGDKSYVAYAKGCDPGKDDDYYENARSLVGGDDFGDVLPLNKSVIEDFASYEELNVLVTENTIELMFSKPKTLKLRRPGRLKGNGSGASA